MGQIRLNLTCYTPSIVNSNVLLKFVWLTTCRTENSKLVGKKKTLHTRCNLNILNVVIFLKKIGILINDSSNILSYNIWRLIWWFFNMHFPLFDTLFVNLLYIYINWETCSSCCVVLTFDQLCIFSLLHFRNMALLISLLYSFLILLSSNYSSAAPSPHVAGKHLINCSSCVLFSLYVSMHKCVVNLQVVYVLLVKGCTQCMRFLCVDNLCKGTF